MKKAVFFDIDGTLIDAVTGMSHMSERVRNSLIELKNAGNYIFIASGRPLDYLDPELVNFGFDGFVLMNGAVVVINDEVIFAEPIDPKIVDMVCQFCDMHKTEYIFESHPKVYLPKSFTKSELFFANLDIDITKFVREFKKEDFPTYKMEFLTTHPDNGQVYYHLLQTPTLTGINDPFHSDNLELYAKKNTKASGILHALEHLGVDVKDSYAFGDGLNDIEMIQTVGCGMAMENGNPKLKALAKHVVPSVHEDGVAYGIERYVL